MSAEPFFARTGPRKKWHIMVADESGEGDVQLCDGKALAEDAEIFEDGEAAGPDIADVCKGCAKLERAAGGDEEPAEPVSDPLEVQEGDAVRCAYVVNGPRLVEVPGVVLAVHEGQKGEPATLDIRCPKWQLLAECVHEGVPYKATPKMERFKPSTSWRCCTA